MARYRTSFDTPEQALAEALFLALMAPGESEVQAATTLAEELAYGLDAATVELAKRTRSNASSTRPEKRRLRCPRLGDGRGKGRPRTLFEKVGRGIAPKGATRGR